MSKKVLLIGCGQLGSRHLQAISRLDDIGEVWVVDARQEGLLLGQQRLKEEPLAKSHIQWQWHTDLAPGCYGGDLCIIATQAEHRLSCFNRAVIEAGYKNILIEKVVAQSVADYQQLLALAASHHVKVWVNCKTRAYGVHQYIKSKINDSPIQMTFVAGNHGLGNNGVHEADLFNFYDESKTIEPVSTLLDQTLITSKRGSAVFDLSGQISGVTSKGSRLVIDFAKDHLAPDGIFIQTAQARFFVDHFTKFALESYASTHWTWQPIAINERWEVSIMTEAFVRDILKQGTCLLPSLSDCYPAHEFILGQLLPTFRKLLNNPSLTHCPIT